MFSRWKKKFLIMGLSILIAAALALSAISDASAWSLKEAAKPYKGKTISVVHVPLFRLAATVAAEDFEKITGIKVKLIEIPFAQLQTKLLTSLMGKTGAYDVVPVNHDQIGLLAEPGYIVKLEEYLRNTELTDPNYDFEDFLSVSGFGTWKGRLVSIPFWPVVHTLNYRKDLFAKYAVAPPPKPPYYWDWPEWEAAAEKLTRDTDGDGKTDLWGTGIPGAMGTELIWWWTDRLAYFGGDWYDRDTYQFEGVTNSLRNLMATEMWIRHWRNYSPPQSKDWQYVEGKQAFYVAGICAMISWFGDLPLEAEDPSKSTIVGKVGHAIVPGGRSILVGFSVGVAADSRNKDAAWLFIEHATSKEMQMRIAKEAKWPISPRRSLWMKPEYRSQVSPDLADAIMFAQEHSWKTAANPENFASRMAISARLHQALMGELSPKEALDKATEDLKPILGHYHE